MSMELFYIIIAYRNTKMCILTSPQLHLLENVVLKQLTYVRLAQVQELPGQFVALATCFLQFGHREEQTRI